MNKIIYKNLCKTLKSLIYNSVVFNTTFNNHFVNLKRGDAKQNKNWRFNNVRYN